MGLVGATGTAAYATHWGDPGSLVLGGVVMGANFWLLRLIVNALCSTAAAPVRHARAAIAVIGVCLKFALFLALLAAVFVHLPIEGMSFACGVTLLLVACVVEAVRADMARAKGVA